MSSKTTMAARQYRLLEWAAQIKDCQNRPAGMGVVSWCACHSITKANYYYRLRCVRQACMESLSEEVPRHPVIPVKPELLQLDVTSSNAQPGLDISVKGFSIRVTASTPMSVLTDALKVVRHAE